jgi:hypothetical protein
MSTSGSGSQSGCRAGRAFAVAFAAMTAAAVYAQPVPWAHPDGSIHYYDILSKPGGMDWNTANSVSGGHGGYLATVTSAAENELLFKLGDSGAFWFQRPGSGAMVGPWLGGYQPPGESGPGVNWRWVDGRSFGYSNWAAGEPNNRSDSNVVGFGSSASTRTSSWSDLDKDDDSVRAAFIELSAESTTVGLTRFDSGAADGYTLFAPMMGSCTYLIDGKGRLVHRWSNEYRLATAVNLLEDGRLLRVANLCNDRFPNGGRVELVDWDGTVTWSYTLSDSNEGQHHDAQVLPNGNVLMLAYEFKGRSEAVTAGRDPTRIAEGAIYPEQLVEVDPATNSVVWEWHLWDHIVQDFDPGKANFAPVADHPELADLNYFGCMGNVGVADWIHANSIDYNPELDQVMISARNFSEVWVIDHSTTTEQARGHSGGRQGMGGDILYRWGNPQAYRAGDSTDQRFFSQHDARWIEAGLVGAGNMMVFNNGSGRPGTEPFSTVDEFIPACDGAGRYPRPQPGEQFGPAAPCWSYGGSRAVLFSGTFSSARRLANGNTLICAGQSGVFTEVRRDSQPVWRYVNPLVDSEPAYQGARGGEWSVFRAIHYAADYPGLTGRNLTPGYPIERYRTPATGVDESENPGIAPRTALAAAPNPFSTSTMLGLAGDRLGGRPGTLSISDATGRIVRVLAPALDDGLSVRWDGNDGSGRPVSRGVYYCRYRSSGRTASAKLVKLN